MAFTGQVKDILIFIIVKSSLPNYTFLYQPFTSFGSFGNDDIVVGYPSLAVGSIEHELASKRTKKGLARLAIPVMILDRLAVASAYQGENLVRFAHNWNDGILEYRNNGYGALQHVEKYDDSWNK
jgi:hypothetical protein